MTACSSHPPLPTDHYYRLPELIGVHSDENLVETISVITFQAGGLHKERAILYSENEIELKQYHYHHWADSPHRLLQERLAERLRLSNLSKVVLTTFEGDSDLIIKGQIKAFERIRNDTNDSVSVLLYFRVDENYGDMPFFNKEYNQSVKVQDSSMISVINAFNTAVNKIYNDLKQSLLQQ
ncbi:MAG: ABC-type transport auxiliary lipoprotein family protein [Proteobacteria bacterium]|nr:ABC-type transport auxiliary lipoprotein family protein [Pseudomonadota bacterium]